MSTRRKTEKTFAPVAALEQRALLAGNVTAKLVSSSQGPDVVITGDASSNSIEIVQLSTDTYTLRGTSSATKINGKAGGTFKFQFDGFDDLLINMGAGDDFLAIQGNSQTQVGDLDITDDLTIDMGSGADRVNLKWLEVKGNLNVKMGTGNDKFNFRDSVLRGKMTVDGGAGFDRENYLNDTIIGSISTKTFESKTNSNLWF
jgi:hypothetical protein